MGVPTVGATLQDVVDEIDGVQSSLQDCVNDAVSGDYDPIYYTAPATSLREFRGYITPAGVTVIAFNTTKIGESLPEDACLGVDNWQRFHDGSGTFPADNDVIYIDNPGTLKFNGGNLYHMYDGGTYTYRVSATGIVSLTDICACFVSGTIILDSSGNNVLIETLKVGDMLLSADLDTLHAYNKVDELNDLSRHGSKIKKIQAKVVEHTIIINNGLLEATPTHRHLVHRNNQWFFTQFQEIEIGDEMYDINKNIIEVTDIDYNIEDRTIYKITLEDTHTYFANGILTHNIK